MRERPPPSGGFLQWWSNDQTFFNEVVHRAQPMAQLGLALKAADGYKNYAGGLKTLGPIKDEVLAAFD